MYTVTQVDNTADVNRNPAEPAEGWIDFYAGEIRLLSSMTPERQWSTLLHEVVHAIDDRNGFDFDEATTDRLANALFCFLRDNDLGLD